MELSSIWATVKIRIEHLRHTWAERAEGSAETLKALLEFKINTLFSCLVLSQEERQKHQHPAVMDDPPHIDVALCAGLGVAREQGDVFGHQKRKVGRCGHPHCV